MTFSDSLGQGKVLTSKSYFAGIDLGSTLTKVVIANDRVLASVVRPTAAEQRKLANRVMEEALSAAGVSLEDITYIVATGYGRINVPFADEQITEISCHARGVASLLPTVRTVIDVGGQDCKAIKLSRGRVVNFAMNDKCAAGTGRFLELTAEALGVRLEDMGPLSLSSSSPVRISNTCTVFAEQEIVSRLVGGVPLADIIAGLHEAMAARIYALAARVKVEKDVAVTGGVARNAGLVKALEARLSVPVLLPPEPLLTGALGAALLARDAAARAAASGVPLVRGERRLQEARFFT